MKLKIISWNIWCDGNFQEMCEFFEVAKADVIALQEVAAEDKTRDVVSYLKNMGYEYVYCPVFQVKKDGRMVGNAIFSKHKILASTIHELSDTNNRKCISADIQAGNTILHIFSVHLLHAHMQASEPQELQAQNLLKVVPPENSIVMGDLNALPESEAFKIISKTLTNTDPSLAPTWSLYPEGCDTCRPQGLNFRFDYIFTSVHLKFSEPRVENSKASDHLPVSIIVEV